MGSVLLLFLQRDIIIVEWSQKLDNCSPFAGVHERALHRSRTMDMRTRKSSAPRTLPEMVLRVVGEIPWEELVTTVRMIDVKDIDQADDKGDKDVGSEVDDDTEDDNESVVEVVGGSACLSSL